MQIVAERHTKGLATWIAQPNRSIHLNSRVEHVTKFFLVLGSHDLHVGKDTHVCNIKNTMLCLTIFSHNTCTIQGENHVEILHTDIMHNLVERTLQKSRIDCYYRAHTSHSQTTGKCHSMLLGDTHVEEALGQMLVQLFEARSTLHRRCNTNNRWILLCNRHKGIGKDLRIRRRITGIFLNLPGCIIIRSRPMPFCRITLSNIPAFAFLRYYLHDDWPINPFEILEDIQQERKVVSIKWAKKFKAQFFKDDPALAIHDKVFETCLR